MNSKISYFTLSLVLVLTFSGLFSQLKAQSIDYDSIISQKIESNSPVVEGRSIALFGHGGTGYAWTGPNNFSSTLQEVIISNVDTTMSGIYYLEVQDSIHDTVYYCSTNVVVTKDQNRGCFQLSQLNCCLNSYVDIFSNYSSSCHFDWSTNIPGLNILPTGTQTITIPSNILPAYSYYYIELSVKCNGEPCISRIYLDIWDCCISTPQYVSVLRNEISSNLTALNFTPKTAIVEKFIVNSPFTIPNNTDIVMVGLNTASPYARIIINENQSLSADQVFLNGCKQMWLGIVIVNNGKLSMTMSTISDMGFGVNNPPFPIPQNNTIHWASCTFLNNYISLRQTFNSPTIYLDDNEFYSDQNIFPNLVPANGILFTSCSPITLANSNPNKFHNLDFGIWLTNTDAFIGKNATQFWDITSQLTNYSGTGVIFENMTSTPSQFSLTKHGNSTGTDFANCRRGILVRNSNADISNNSMIDVGTGILIDECETGTISVYGNDLHCSGIGIDIQQSTPLLSLDVNSNNIEMDAPFKPGFGIRVSQFNQTPQSGALISFNSITLNGAAFGVDLNSAPGYSVLNNTINLLDPQINFAGISLTNSESCTVRCNQILGVDPAITSGNKRPMGIKVESSLYSRISFNMTDDTYAGVVFEGISDPCSFDHHDFFDHTCGLFYSASATTGIQDLKENRFWGTYGQWAARSEQNPLGDQYTVGANCQNCMPPSQQPGTFFYSIPNQTPNDPNPCSNPLPENMVAGIGVNFLTETDTSIALNQLNFSNFEDQLNWNSNRYLYGKLDQNSGLATTNTLMDSFYDSIENLSPARYQDIELSLKEANTLQPVTISFIENLRELMAVLHDSIAKIDSLMRIDPPAANPLVLENLRMSLMSQMAVLNGQLKAAIDGFYSVYLQNINDLSTENLTLVDTSVFESNEQLINDIYFNTFARGENNLTDVQKNIIVSVASQCPLSGGKAVYLARCLLVKFSDTLFNDYESCLMEGIIKNGTINLLNQLNFTCSPNPADTHLQISCDQAIDEQAILSIYNNTGMKVTQDGIDLKQKTHTFDTCKLLPGVYFLQIVCHNSVQNLGKIIISH